MTLTRRDWITLRRREGCGNWKRNCKSYSLETRFRWGYGPVLRKVLMVKMGYYKGSCAVFLCDHSLTRIVSKVTKHSAHSVVVCGCTKPWLEPINMLIHSCFQQCNLSLLVFEKVAPNLIYVTSRNIACLRVICREFSLGEIPTLT